MRTPLLLALAALLAGGCGTAPSQAPTEAPSKPAETSEIRKTIDDAVDATITHKSQIEAFQRAKSRLKGLDEKNRQLIRDLEGQE